MAANKTGRPSRLTAEMQESICTALRAGNYMETAAAMNGVSKVSIYSWLKRGARERDRLATSSRQKASTSEAQYLAFLNAVEKAQAQSESRDVALIGRAAETQWQAAAWRLERKHYTRWGRKQQLEHSGSVSLRKITDDELEAEIRRRMDDDDGDE